MAYQSICLVLLACTLNYCVAQYAIPDIKFEAFTPKGLRISIPADKGVELFAFHGKVNKPIVQIEPGEFNEDVTRPSNGRFVYVNPSLKLKKGDVINYWVFVQHDQLGFRKDDLSWTVDNLLPQADLEQPPQESCSRSLTKIQGKNIVCTGEDILKDDFSESPLNQQLWLIEQFIPNAPDWEYVIYKNEPDVIGVENNKLYIKPKVVPENVMKNIEIEGCTRRGNPNECSKSFVAILQPPIVSGRIVSKSAFCFAKISIRAKLPQGDWLYPEIYLEDIDDPKRRILIAYARGNKELTGNNGVDIGGKFLFGGPHKTPKEPDRSNFLRSHKAQNHIGNDWHIFTVTWSKDQILLYIDDINYGTVNAEALQSIDFNKENMVRLVLGVGAGGLYDFPDNFKSGDHTKPWKNMGKTAIKDFFNKRDIWQGTWSENSQLLVEYVNITAL